MKLETNKRKAGKSTYMWKLNITSEQSAGQRRHLKENKPSKNK